MAALAVTGCARRTDPLGRDIAVFCRAWDDRGRPARLSVMAEYLASHLESKELLELFANIPPDGDPHLIAKLRAFVARAGATSCPTLEWMATKYPDPDAPPER